MSFSRGLGGEEALTIQWPLKLRGTYLKDLSMLSTHVRECSEPCGAGSPGVSFAPLPRLISSMVECAK